MIVLTLGTYLTFWRAPSPQSTATRVREDSRDIGGDAQSGDPGNSKMARSTDHFEMEIRIRFGAHRPGKQKVLELC
jgi:hypothetical protein